ncbi:hypothetical protein EV702DRAFT_1198718 [Suillus placidus]|uniref:Uncharacterized protein n=1 Tax=Suillus placidus TaxID=48579 RepID=A0A9P6ZT22_9AGAM|nr:hypothetical protein EV702DRAFT_1198718 [Suillus placidus]
MAKKNTKTKAPTGPLVIPSKPNPDWREAARRRRAGVARFIPDSAKASTGADGSVGGLGAHDTINSGPQLSGIQFGNKEVKVDTGTTSTDGETNTTIEEHVNGRKTKKPFARCWLGIWTRRLRSILFPFLPAEPTRSSKTLLIFWILMTMRNALVEPYLPKSRPALLGIGAKEQEALDDGSKKKKWRGYEKRYVPLVRQESSREESRNESAIVSRRASRSSERRSGGESREKVIAIGDENATVTIEEIETEMTGGEEMIVEGTATGTWTDETEITMSINVVTEFGTTTTATDEETGRANGEDGTDEINMGTITPFIATSVLCAEHADRRLLDLDSFNSS